MANRPKILIIEDDPTFGKLLRLTVASMGFDVQLVADLEEARAAVDAGLPQLVISDRRLKPDGDGVEFCARLKKSVAPRLLPVILLSASEEIDRRIAERPFGPDLYLAKSPENLLALEGRIRQLLG